MKALFNVSGSGLLNAFRGGAIERVIAKELDLLSREERVSVFGSLFPLDDAIKNAPFARQMFASKTPLGMIQDLYTLVDGCRRIFRIDADVVVSTHCRNSLMSFLYSRKKHVPLVAWELDHVMLVPPWNSLKRLHQRTIRAADLVITESQKQKERLISCAIDPDRITVVRIGIDTIRYSPNIGAGKEKESYILYVAKFTERKNHLSLLQAFARLSARHSDLKLFLVGPKGGSYTGLGGQSDCYKIFESHARHLGVFDRIVFKERVAEEELIELYRGCEVFAFPSKEEGFGLALLEAMACGCACISNDVEPMRELLGNTGALVNVEDDSDFARELERLLDNRDRREATGILAREQAVDKYDSALVHAKFHDCLLSAVPKSTGLRSIG